MKAALAAALIAVALQAAPYQRIHIPVNEHPAIDSAAKILASKLRIPVTSSSPQPGDILLTTDRKAARNDGYSIVFQNGMATIRGARPRSLLYAAGDVEQWKSRTSGVFVREPSFAIRTASYDGSGSIAEYVAELGINILISRPNPSVVTLEHTLPEVFALLSPAEQARLKKARAEQARRNQLLVKEAHDADVPIYAFLYGNDPTGWSRSIYEAAIRAFPSMKGTPQPNS